MDPYSVYMDLDEAVTTLPKSGEPDMTTVAECAELLNVDPAKLLSFVLGEREYAHFVIAPGGGQWVVSA